MLKKFFKHILSFFFTKLAKLNLTTKSSIKVNFYSKFTSKTYIEDDCHFNGLRVSGKGCVFIGSGFHCGKSCEIITDVHNYHGASLPYDDTYIIKDVTIKKNVWFGQGVTILGGVTIGEGAIVQAKSVVVSDVPDFAIVGGHPAKTFAERDKAHYYSLVE